MNTAEKNMPNGLRLLTLLLTMTLATPAMAVRIEDLGRLKGGEQSKLVGMGLVVGLKGSGDGGKFLPAMRPLAKVVAGMIDDTVIAEELKDAKNVALVTITATLPAVGVREGDQIDVHVSAIGPAKSLEGGRLFLTPLTGPTRNSSVFAFAEGPIVIEKPDFPTTGLVRSGAQLTRDVFARYLDTFGRITFVLNDANASWIVANNIADLINGSIAPDGPKLAKAIDARNIVIDVPQWERADPSRFISDILRTGVHPTFLSSGAKVVINERTGTIVVSGDVRVSPVIVSHRGLTITTVAPLPDPTVEAPRTTREEFLLVDPEDRGGTRLVDLLETLNQLKVDARDRIEIIMLIYKSQKLHGELVIE